jgi:BMFP domain-containing protein YqiC
MAPPKKTQRFVMSDAHKEALAQGRQEGRAVRHYLSALEAHKPKRGRKRTTETVQKRLAAVEKLLGSADSVNKLDLIQERLDLQKELASKAKVDLEALEREFVKVAKGYAQRKGISYAAWREFGVDAAVLKKAGIGR